MLAYNTGGAFTSSPLSFFHLSLDFVFQITGSIPVSIVKPALTFLDLSMNRITGVMPHNVGDNLPTALALEKVYLYNNSITGQDWDILHMAYLQSS